MDFKGVDPAEIIVSLLKDKICLKHKLEEKDTKIKFLEKRLNMYEKVG